MEYKQEIKDRIKTIYAPGDIVYSDSNGEKEESYFGVVVDRDFWLEEVKREDVLMPEIIEFEKDGTLEKKIPLRVLGTKFFRQYWKTNDPERFESEDKVVMRYRPGPLIYTSKIDLRSTIELCKVDNGRVGTLLFGRADYYVGDALREAKIVYDYLDGKRFDSSGEYIFREDKLLRLLERAIPTS